MKDFSLYGKKYMQRLLSDDGIVGRFLSKTKQHGDCIEWTGSKTIKGYGQFRIFNKLIEAHRISYELFVGNAPEYTDVCHKCDNPSCVNPDHLFLGSRSKNMIDMMKKGRGSTNKLTIQDVKIVKECIANGFPMKEISRYFKINLSSIYDIKTGDTWAYVSL